MVRDVVKAVLAVFLLLFSSLLGFFVGGHPVASSPGARRAQDGHTRGSFDYDVGIPVEPGSDYTLIVFENQKENVKIDDSEFRVQ